MPFALIFPITWFLSSSWRRSRSSGCKPGKGCGFTKGESLAPAPHRQCVKTRFGKVLTKARMETSAAALPPSCLSRDANSQPTVGSFWRWLSARISAPTLCSTPHLRGGSCARCWRGWLPSPAGGPGRVRPAGPSAGGTGPACRGAPRRPCWGWVSASGRTCWAAATRTRSGLLPRAGTRSGQWMPRTSSGPAREWDRPRRPGGPGEAATLEDSGSRPPWSTCGQGRRQSPRSRPNPLPFRPHVPRLPFGPLPPPPGCPPGLQYSRGYFKGAEARTFGRMEGP